MTKQTKAQRLADRLSTGVIDREGTDTLAAAAELRRLDALNAELVAALHHISLASQNSMSSQRECGVIARTALAKAKEQT